MKSQKNIEFPPCEKEEVLQLMESLINDGVVLQMHRKKESEKELNDEIRDCTHLREVFHDFDRNYVAINLKESKKSLLVVDIDNKVVWNSVLELIKNHEISPVCLMDPCILSKRWPPYF